MKDPETNDRGERELTSLLRERLPKYGAPPALKAQIAAALASSANDAANPANDAAPTSSHAAAETSAARPESKRRAQRVGVVAAIVLAAAAIVLLAVGARGTPAPSPLAIEAVSDHLRIVYAEHPIEIPSGGIHQVKPWFTGKLDFAPIVAFGGDDDFPLEGGSVAYFVDRKAAAFLFKRRLHTISLFVFRADDLPWPSSQPISAGNLRLHESTSRGFHVVLWQREGLGYALVSDVDRAELVTLASKITPEIPANAARP